MDFTGKKLLNKLIAIVAILAMTLSDFVLVGANLVSYAVDVATTTSKNVEFTSYFVEANGDKVSKVERDTDATDLKMFVEISVKNEGYLDGAEISLENSNFKIKDKILSESVSKIEANKVYLNRINAGKITKIELEIDKNLPDTMPESLLKAETNVVLQGKYTDSNSTKDISGKSKVEIDWKTGENVNAETNLELLTNKVFEIQGQQKRIVQLLLTSKLTNNSYPVKNTKIDISTSQGAEEVTVEARSTASTNGNAEFTNQNYQYNQEQGILTINVNNNTNSNQNIAFNKNVEDKYIVTYTYPIDFEYQGTEILAETAITTYDNKQKTAENNLQLQDEIDGIITYEVSSAENEMYKGKIYTGENRNYESTTKINVNKAGIAEKIEVYEIYAGYKADAMYGAKIFFNSTKVSKEEFNKIFGTEGYIIFRDRDENEISRITNLTTADESGNINISYPEDIREVKIETSKPISVGTLKLINTKTIKETSYNREKVRTFEYISENVRGNYENQEYKVVENRINLKETSSRAIVNVSNTSLSTTESTNTKITVILETDKESKDLYKNPSIKVTLPKQVKEILGMRYRLVHGNGLSIESEKIETEGENLVILFKLSGEQTKYVTDVTEGPTLIIDANLKQDNLAITSKEEIKVNYTNENAVSYEDNGEQKVQVNIIAKNPIITANKINELDTQTSTEERKDVELSVDSQERTLTKVMDIVNNETGKITDVKILGKYPVDNSKNNLGITITTPTSSITQKEGVKIYYSTVENPTNDLANTNNKWTENKESNAKSYLIVINSLEVGEKYTFGYKMKVPANLQYNLSAEEGFEVGYTNSASNTANTIKSTVIELNTGKSAVLEQTAVAKVGNEEIKDGDTVKAGEIIKYSIKIKNNGNEDATGVTIVGNIPEGTNYVEYSNLQKPENPTVASIPETIIEDNNKTEVKYSNQTIKAKSELTFEYMVRVNTNSDKQSTFTLTTTEASNKVTTTNIAHKLQKEDIRVDVEKLDSIYSDVIKSGYNYRYKIVVKNTSNKEQKDLKLDLNVNELLKFEKAYYSIGDKVLETTEKTIAIEKIAAGETINIIVETIPNQPTNSVKQAEISAILTKGNDKVRSNIITEKVDAIELDISFTSQSNSKAEGYLHTGDKVQYKLNIKNIGKIDATKLEIRDEFSDFLELEEITLNGENVKYTRNEVYGEGINYSIINIPSSLKVGETANIIIKAKVKDSLKIDSITKIVNTATLYNEIEIAKTDEIVYFIEKTSKKSEANGSDENQSSEQNPSPEQSPSDSAGNASNEGEKSTEKENTGSNSNIATYSITGTAWKDENENGARDKGEELLSDINVRILDVQNKKYLTDSTGKEITAKSNSEGLYTLSNVPAGKYIIVFEYDTSKYMLTTYSADGVANDRNSDVVLNTITINGDQKQLATTDTIDLQNSIANIDIGLLDAKVFDLELQKYITKIVVTNNAGTSTYDYKDATLAKADIAAKNLKDSQVVVEYTIKVKNAGEIAGYVKNVVDYKSTELSFSSTLNKDWYAQGDNLYNASLANTKLEPGETKELKLILTKTMTESNTGLISNTAEISEAYNTRGALDKDSSTGNKEIKEDDMGQADIIIGVKTGAAISYLVITLSIIIVIGVAGYLVSKKVLSKEIKFE